jgi:hypothetical protein
MKLAQTLFWRTTNQQEIDYIEINAEVTAFEIKMKVKRKASK